MNYTKADSEQFFQVDTTLFCPYPENSYCTHKFGLDAPSHIASEHIYFRTPTILMLLLRVNTYSISDICMLCWECIGASIYGLGAGRLLPNPYQAHKLRSCHLSHLPSNTESEHSTAPGSADRPGGNGVHLHKTSGSPSCFFANVITNTQT